MFKRTMRRVTALVIAILMLIPAMGIDVLADELQETQPVEVSAVAEPEEPAQADVPATEPENFEEESPQEIEVSGDEEFFEETEVSEETPIEEEEIVIEQEVEIIDNRPLLQALIEDEGGAYVFTGSSETVIYKDNACTEQLGTIYGSGAYLYATQWVQVTDGSVNVRVLFATGYSDSHTGYVPAAALSSEVVSDEDMLLAHFDFEAVLSDGKHMTKLVNFVPVATEEEQTEVETEEPAEEETAEEEGSEGEDESEEGSEEPSEGETGSEEIEETEGEEIEGEEATEEETEGEETEEEELEEVAVEEVTLSENGVTVTVSAEALPEGVALENVAVSITPVILSEETLSEAAGEGNVVVDYVAYDICLIDTATGEEFEPVAEISVAMPSVNEEAEIFHLTDSGELETVEGVNEEGLCIFDAERRPLTKVARLESTDIFL